MMPLILANPGEQNIIKKVGGSSDTRKFLENLGFVAGGVVTVISEIIGTWVTGIPVLLGNALEAVDCAEWLQSLNKTR